MAEVESPTSRPMARRRPPTRRRREAVAVVAAAARSRTGPWHRECTAMKAAAAAAVVADGEAPLRSGRRVRAGSRAAASCSRVALSFRPVCRAACSWCALHFCARDAWTAMNAIASSRELESGQGQS